MCRFWGSPRSTVGGWSLAVLPMTPETAEQYLSTLTDLGAR
jgi:hypothetical protein